MVQKAPCTAKYVSVSRHTVIAALRLGVRIRVEAVEVVHYENANTTSRLYKDEGAASPIRFTMLSRDGELIELDPFTAFDWLDAIGDAFDCDLMSSAHTSTFTRATGVQLSGGTWARYGDARGIVTSGEGASRWRARMGDPGKQRRHAKQRANGWTVE